MGLMKIAIVGAGAIGGYAGVKLALAGERVTVTATVAAGLGRSVLQGWVS